MGLQPQKPNIELFGIPIVLTILATFSNRLLAVKKITNQPIDMQPSGRPSICIGDTVQMVNCPEAKRHQNKLWKVTWGPLFMCGTWVVWLKDYSGAFACEYLQRIKTQK